MHDGSYHIIWFQVSCMEQCFTSTLSTEMVTLTVSWDTPSTSGSTLCSWTCCGSLYRLCSSWMHGGSCQPPRHTLTKQSQRGTDKQEEVTLGLLENYDMRLKGKVNLGKHYVQRWNIRDALLFGVGHSMVCHVVPGNVELHFKGQFVPCFYNNKALHFVQ